jgi:predicted lipoprotein with Yx(FWY)xxD motif
MLGDACRRKSLFQQENEMKKTWICAALFTLPLAALAEQPMVKNNTLVDEHGKTLYMFDADTKDGNSACAGPCASVWPAATADDYDKAGGDWSLVKTGDGKHQWAYKGHRLYTYSKDEKPGDMNGDGFKGVWHVAKP